MGKTKQIESDFDSTSELSTKNVILESELESLKIRVQELESTLITLRQENSQLLKEAELFKAKYNEIVRNSALHLKF